MNHDSMLFLMEATVKKNRKRERHSIRNTYFFNRILQFFIGGWLKTTFHITLETPHFFRGIKPPYVVIANHNCFWGPFMNGAIVPDPIHYIVSDSNFRNPLTNLFLSMVGSIPKTKAMTDMETLKHIIDIKNKNGVIGLYPEGQNSYDGHFLPIPYATGKLLKHLRIPVVMVHKHGAYLSYPRWSKSLRRGKITIGFSMAFTADELKAMSAEAVYSKLVEILSYDEFDWQRKHMVSFKGKDRAEYLEILLFVCPHCREVSTMRSEGDRFFCTSCGYTLRLNEQYFFELSMGDAGRTPDSVKPAEAVYHDNLRDWNVWQLGFLEEYISGRLQAGGVLLEEEEMLLKTGYKIEPLQPGGEGRLKLTGESVEFHEAPEGRVQSFPVSELKGINMHNNEMLEFYYGDTLYNFSSADKRKSLYKWYNALTVLRNQLGLH